MLELRTNGTALDLVPDQSISFTASNPAFDNDLLDRSFSLPFSLPFTARNSAARRHSGRLDNAQRAVRQPAELRVGGATVFRGSLRQTEAGETKEEVSFANESLSLWSKLKDVRIRTLLPTLTFKPAGQGPAEWKYQLNTGPLTYTMTISQGTATATSADGSNLALEIASRIIRDQLNAWVPGFARVGLSGAIFLDAALLESNPILNVSNVTLALVEGVHLQNYNNVVAHVHAVNQTPVETHCFPVIRWPSFYGTKNTAFANNGGLINGYASGTFFPTTEYPLADTDRWENNVVPCVRLPYILEQIALAVGYSEWSGEVWADADFQKLFMPNNYALDKITQEYYGDFVRYKRNTFKETADLNNHVPDITADVLIKWVCTTFALYLQAEGGRLFFRKKRTQLAGETTDVTSRIERSYRLKANANRGWKLTYDRIESETLTAPSQLLPLVFGEGETLTEVAPTFYFYTGVDIGGFGEGKVPTTLTPGVSDVYDNKPGSTLPFALLFYYGLQPTESATLYPFASHDNITQIGTQVGNYSLEIQGPFGLHEKWHRGYIELSDADSVEISLLMHIGELRELLRWEHTKVTFNHPLGAVTGIVKTVEYSISERGLFGIKISLLK